MSRNRQLLQTLYVRVCRDSRFGLPFDRAASLVAMIAHCHPLDVWLALPSMDVMQEIAAGIHPAARAPKEGKDNG